MTITSSGSEIVYHASLPDRITIITICVFLITAFPIMWVSGMFSTRPNQTSVSDPIWFMVGFLELIPIAITCPLLRSAGPNDLYVNLTERTYRHVSGWFFAPDVRTGSLDADIAGICVDCLSLNSAYSVRMIWKIDWKPGQKWFYPLGLFNRSGRADRLAAEISSTLSLPLIKAP